MPPKKKAGAHMKSVAKSVSAKSSSASPSRSVKKPKGRVSSSPSPKKKASSSSPSPKKTKSEVQSALFLVEAALTYGYGVPSNPILEKMCSPCLGTPLVERQALQHRGVELLTKQFALIQEKLRNDLHDKEDFLKNSDRALVNLTREHERLLARGLQLNEQKRGLEQKVTEEKATVESAQQALTDAKAFRDEIINSSGTLSKNLKVVKDVQKDQLKTLMQIPPSDSSKMMKVVISMCKNILNLDSSVVLALPSVLKKAPADRGPFDATVLQEFEKQLWNWVMDTEYKVNNKEVREADAKQKVAQCETHVQAAKADLRDAEELLVMVTKKIAENKASAKAEEKNLKEHPKTVKEIEKQRDTLQEDVNKFAQVMHKFLWLKNRSPGELMPSGVIVPRENPFDLLGGDMNVN